jgi:hypothetical protein
LVDKIHLLKTMTAELSEIQVLDKGSDSGPRATRGRGGGYNVRNVYSGMEGGLGRRGDLSVRIHGGKHWLGGIARGLGGRADLFVCHGVDCES